jgi:transglutaminase-like putative cysteine protease
VTTYAASRGFDEPDGRDLSPEEGWTVVALLVVMILAVGIAVDSARWVGTTAAGESRTGFLPIVLLAGAAWGFVAAKSTLPAALVHLIGAIIGTVLVIVLVAGVNSTAAELSERLAALSASLDRFGVDILVRQVRSAETSAFLLVTGCIAWATGAYAAFAVFRRHRPMDALVVLGLLLLANLSLTYEFLFPHLVVFAAAGLLLLVRANLDEQRSGWLRRRIGDAGHVSGLFMRGGLTFVAVAVIGAVLLTTVASSNPLAGVWRTYQSDIAGVGQQLNRWVGGLSAPARGPNSLFGASQTIQSLWQSSNEIAYLAETSDGLGQYWRAATYDDFSGDSWNQTARTAVRVEPGAPVLGGTTREIAEAPDRHEVTATITAIQPAGDSLLAPEIPSVVDRPLSVVLSGEGGPFLTADFADGLRENETYEVVSLVRNPDKDTGLTQRKLAATPQSYPGWLSQYIVINEGSIGQTTRDVADAIVAELPADERHAFHIATAMQAYLRDSGQGFEYDDDVRGLCQSGQVIDCFLREGVRRGFCQQFASAMVMMLRTQDIPARLAMGYLPGTRRASDGVWQIDRGAAHAWVEVYFVGEGWVRFDPTPGGPVRERGGTGTVLPLGEPVPSPSTGPGASGAPRRTFEGINEPGEDEIGGGTLAPLTPGGPDGGWLAVALVALLAVAFAVAGYSVRERRRPSQAPEVVYGGMARLASRFGYGPRPTQTAYEYADALGEVIPAARGELALVARVKVETQYARRTPSPDVLLAVRHAYRRIRVRLLALIFRRPWRWLR